MINNKTDKIRLLKCLIAGTFILIFLGLIITSRSLAQWPPYNDYSSFTDSFFNPAFSLSNSPYGNYPLQTSTSSDLRSRRLESYGNYSYNDIFSPYSNSFLTSGSFVSPALSFFNSPYGNYSSQTSPLYPEAIYVGQDKGGSYTEPTSNNPFFPSISLSFMPNMFNPYTLNIPNPYITSGSPGWFPSWPSPFVPFPSSIIRVPKSPDPEPSDEPEKMTGEWKSQQLTDEDGNKIKGKLEYNQNDDSLKILDSSLPLGEGELTEFKYTPTSGEAPISFNGVFDSGYTAYFSGKADNHLCPRDAYCALAGWFEVEGEYVIKNSIGQIVDKGAFSLSY